VYYILLFLIGLLIGSLINVIVWRMYHDQPFVTGRSKCVHCQHVIAWYDNIPLLSFILLRAQCRHCKNKISFYYPCVEFATGILFLLTGTGIALLQTNVYSVESLLRNLFFVSVLVVIFVMDLRWYIILDKVIVPAIAVTFLLNWLGNIYTVKSLLIAMLIGGLFFFIQWFVSRGQWLGSGDIRMGILMGAMLGYPNVIGALFVSYMIGGTISIFFLVFKLKELTSKLPLATFLSIGTFVYVVFEAYIRTITCQLHLFFLC